MSAWMLAIRRCWLAVLVAGLLFAASAAAGTGAAASQSWRIDLSKAGVPGTKGWTVVTPRSRASARQAGFASDARVLALSGPRAWRALAPLARHGVHLNGRLEVPLPPGRYAVWLLSAGLGQRWVSSVVDDVFHGLTVEGRRVRARPGRPAAAKQIHRLFHEGWDRTWRPGDDPWALQVAPLFQQHMVEVQVDDGALTILGQRLQLRAVAIEPVARRQRLQADVIATWQELALHFARVADPREAPPQHPGRAPSAEERKSGLQIWRQPIMEPMAPGSRPPATQGPTASPVVLPVGGRAVVVVGVRALKELRDARLSVRLLAGGQVVMNDALVRLRSRRLVYNWRSNGVLRPSHLLPVAAHDASGGLPSTLDPGVARAIWIDLWRHSAAGARSSQKLQLEVTVAVGGDSSRLLIPLDLRPWTLMSPYEAGHFVLHDARPSVLASHVKSFFPKAWKQGRPHVLAHLKGLGLLPQITEIDGRVEGISGPNPKVLLHATDKARFIADVQHFSAAFPGVPVTVTMHWTISGRRFPIKRLRGAPDMKQPDAFFRAMRLYLQAMEEVRKAHPKWPPFRYVLAAEPGNRFAAGVAYGRRILEATRPVGVRTIACLITPAAVDALRSLSDVIATNKGVPGEDPSISDLPDGDSERWVYQFGRRVEAGFLAARVGATGGFREFYQHGHGRAFNNFDGDDMAQGALAMPVPGGVVSTPHLERTALGLVDLRVVWTLRRLIRQARRSDRPAVKKQGERALDVLAFTLAQVEPDSWRQQYVLGAWAPEAWGRLLAPLYREIEALHAALIPGEDAVN